MAGLDWAAVASTVVSFVLMTEEVQKLASNKCAYNPAQSDGAATSLLAVSGELRCILARRRILMLPTSRG